MPTKRAVPRPELDEDEAEVPSPPKAAAHNGDDGDGDDAGEATNLHDALRSGNAAAKREAEATSSWAQTFRPDDKSQIIKFLEPEAYVSFRRHWVERTTPEGKQNRPWTCLQSVKQECPLCKIGLRPQAISCYNIALLDSSGDITLRSWEVTVRVLQVVLGYADDPKVGPLTRGFFSVSKTGQKATTQYNIWPVKASALEEDYDVPLPDEAELKSLKLYDKSIVEITPAKKLRELADELVNDYD